MALNPEVKTKAIQAYERYKNDSRIKEHSRIIVVDYTKHSRYKRLYVVSLSSGEAYLSYRTAHGINSSDPKNPAKSISFSNKVMSKKSSIGAAVTGSAYYGKYGKSLNLHGLEKTNSNMFVRRIVIHKSKYVTNTYLKKHGRIGRSWGCPAVTKEAMKRLLALAEKGTFVYFYGGQDE
jgi:hypothetical protein